MSLASQSPAPQQASSARVKLDSPDMDPDVLEEEAKIVASLAVGLECGSASSSESEEEEIEPVKLFAEGCADDPREKRHDHAKGVKISEAKRAAQHLDSVEDGFKGFACGCAAARSKGIRSCLELFTKAEMRQVHQGTYGSRGEVQTQKVASVIHSALWGLATPLPAPVEHRTFKIEQYRILGKSVCQKSFVRGLGGSRHMHRQKLAEVMRGHGPESIDLKNQEKLALASFKQRRGRHENRRCWADNWWANELILQDWMPNENRIVYRGPDWKVLHEKCYAEAAACHSTRA